MEITVTILKRSHICVKGWYRNSNWWLEKKREKAKQLHPCKPTYFQFFLFLVVPVIPRLTNNNKKNHYNKIHGKTNSLN